MDCRLFRMLGEISGDDIERAVQSFVTSQQFSYIGVPLIFLLLGTLSKWLGRREGDTAPHRNELAVGTSVFVMTTGKIASDLCAPKAHVATLLAWALLTFICIFASAGVDRHLSWVPNATGASNRKRWLLGILLPDVVALSVFWAYQYMKIRFK